MTIRKILDSEYEELRAVWCEVFEDDPLFVDEFYYALSAEGYALEDDSKLHSFLTLFNAGEITGQQVQISYAVCTRPESRGKGYAGELVKYVRDKVIADGNISLVCPADDPLVRFYFNLGYEPAFYVKDVTARANNLNLTVSILDYDDYNSYREEFLSGIPHIRLNNRLARFIKDDSVNAQGMLLVNDGDAICTINYGTDDEMGLSELLVNPILAARSSEIAEQIAGGLATLFEVKKIYFRSPTFVVYTDESGNKYSQGSYVQGMASGNKEELDTAAVLPYYGFPMD